MDTVGAGFNRVPRLGPCVWSPSYVFHLTTESSVISRVGEVSTFPAVLKVLLVFPDVDHTGGHCSAGVEVGPQLDLVHTHSVSHHHFDRSPSSRLVVVRLVVRLVGQINFDLLNYWNSVRESYVVPVTRLSGSLNVASLYQNLLFSRREV